MEYLGKTGSKNMLNLIMLHFHKVFERAKNPAARRPFCKNIERLISAKTPHWCKIFYLRCIEISNIFMDTRRYRIEMRWLYVSTLFDMSFRNYWQIGSYVWPGINIST